MKIAAVRAVSTATRELAICAPGVRRSPTSSPERSTNHHAVTVLQRVLLGGVEDGIEAGFIETRWVYCEVIAQAPFAASVAGQTAESVVINGRSASGPPKQKFMTPGRWISPSSAPSGSKTCTR